LFTIGEGLRDESSFISLLKSLLLRFPPVLVSSSEDDE
jgi:hypothetical protein